MGDNNRRKQEVLLTSALSETEYGKGFKFPGLYGGIGIKGVFDENSFRGKGKTFAGLIGFGTVVRIVAVEEV